MKRRRRSLNGYLRCRFTKGLLYNERRDATLMTVFMNPELFDSDRRGTIVEDVTAIADGWSEDHRVPLYLSGCPSSGWR